MKCALELGFKKRIKEQAGPVFVELVRHTLVDKASVFDAAVPRSPGYPRELQLTPLGTKCTFCELLFSGRL